MSSITISMENPALPATPATIYIGRPAALNVVLTNTSGADIMLGETAQLEVFLPQYFTAAQLGKMSLENIAPASWVFKPGDGSLLLNWSGGKSVWANASTITFTISNVVSDHEPRTDSVQVNPIQLSGSGVPPLLLATLVLEVPPAQGNASLRDALSCASEFGGSIYVSSSSNVLTNTIYLTLRNLGDKPLYHGKQPRTGTPEITVSFVYGTTSGSLAPAEKQQPVQTGSAWAISGAVDVDQTGGWKVNNPDPKDNTPVWKFRPTEANQQCLGIGDQSNVTFSFSNIVSITPVGATQMYVQFAGFMADDNQAYDGVVFVVPLNKQNPPRPGGIGIYCPLDSIEVMSSTEAVSIPLCWSMFGVGSAKLSFKVSGMTLPDFQYTYDNAHPALNYDTEYPKLTGFKHSLILQVYCSLYSDTGFMNLLNKIECTVPLVFNPMIKKFEITPVKIEPPHSYAFLLEWTIVGETQFEILEGSQTLPVPQSDTSVVVHPTRPETVYTLNIYGGNARTQEE